MESRLSWARQQMLFKSLDCLARYCESASDEICAKVQNVLGLAVNDIKPSRQQSAVKKVQLHRSPEVFATERVPKRRAETLVGPRACGLSWC